MKSRRLLGSSGIRASLAVCLLASTILVAQASVTPATAESPIYVALGDSYTSGPLIPVQEEPWGCLKSTNNYAKMLAARIGATLRDASCSGAKTKDMTEAQGVTPSPNPPQFDRLDAGVSLVTLQIGGNDIGFGGIAETCGRAAFERRSCKAAFTNPDGSDELSRRIAETAPKIAAVLDGIHAKAPNARVLVLGYPGIFKLPNTGPAACPAMLVGEGDASYLRGIQEKLNAMIATEAAADGSTYVDVYLPSTGKTACDLPVLRWVEPIVPANAAAPIHPNIMGMIGMTDVIQASLNA